MTNGSVALRDALRDLDISVVMWEFPLYINLNDNGTLADGAMIHPPP